MQRGMHGMRRAAYAACASASCSPIGLVGSPLCLEEAASFSERALSVGWKEHSAWVSRRWRAWVEAWMDAGPRSGRREVRGPLGAWLARLRRKEGGGGGERGTSTHGTRTR